MDGRADINPSWKYKLEPFYFRSADQTGFAGVTEIQDIS